MNNSRIFPKQEFSYLREMTLLEIHRQGNLSIKEILSLKKEQIYITENQFLIDRIYPMSQTEETFFFLLTEVAPDSKLLFPTVSGKQLRLGKFIEHVNHLFKKAKINAVYKLQKLSSDQMQQLLTLQFEYQKPRYQRILACALMGVEATRPSEIAQLEKRDINLGSETITLKVTKSQEIQQIPIYPQLVPILRRYLSHLPNPKTPLFSRSSGRKWSRKNILYAMKEFGEYCGIHGVTAQRMRPTVVMELFRNGATLEQIMQLTRHKYLATLLEHYINPLKNNARKALEHLYVLS